MENSRAASSSSSLEDMPAPAYRELTQPRTSRPPRYHSRSQSSSRYVTGGVLPPPSPPSSQTVHDHRSQSSMAIQYDQMGTFFGERAADTGRPSQSSNRSASTHAHSQTRVPPPYDSRSELESLPTYTKEDTYDAETNRKLFLYGFIFFPLWIVGIIAPFVRPERDPSKDNRSKEAQETEDLNMRQIEIRWAKRCACALMGFVLLIVVAVVVGVTVSKHH